MNQLKVCFIGIGSIAKRHIRNLHTVCDKRGIELHVDAVRRNAAAVGENAYTVIRNANVVGENGDEVKRNASVVGRNIDTVQNNALTVENAGIERVFSWAEIKTIPNDYDAVFITNPTEMHLETLKQFHEKGKHFFIEKPVVSCDQIEEAKLFLPRKDAVYYVAAPLRYNAVIRWAKENINPEDVISVRSISSSYLPDWRPGQDYRQTYSAHKDMGGGVSIDLIHEWDYLTFLFGWPKNVKSFIGKKSNLETDSDDYAIYIAEYADKIAELHLDYFGRQTIREMQLFTKNDTIVCDIENHKVSFLKSGQEIEFHEERDDYQIRELEHFLDLIEKMDEHDSDIAHAIKVLELTQGVLQ